MSFDDLGKDLPTAAGFAVFVGAAVIPAGFAAAFLSVLGPFDIVFGGKGGKETGWKGLSGEPVIAPKSGSSTRRHYAINTEFERV